MFMWCWMKGQGSGSACKVDSARFEKASSTSVLSILGCFYAAPEVEFISPNLFHMHQMSDIENAAHVRLVYVSSHWVFIGEVCK